MSAPGGLPPPSARRPDASDALQHLNNDNNNNSNSRISHNHNNSKSLGARESEVVAVCFSTGKARAPR
jgi:hypothetical protein